MPDFERSNFTTGIIVSTQELRDHVRQDLTAEDDLIDGYLEAAVKEIEAYAQIALLTQTVTATFDGPFEAGRIRLPVGPVASGATATVTLIEQDGTETALTASQFRLVTGAAPALWVIDGVTLPTGMSKSNSTLKVEYPPGFGTTPDSIPRDLKHAVMEAAAWLYEMRAFGRQHRHTPAIGTHAARLAQRYRRASV